MHNDKLLHNTLCQQAVSVEELIQNESFSPIHCVADEAISYHMNLGGSRTRTYLTLTSANQLNIDSNDAVILAAVNEMLHNASLVHDDLCDGDTQRRGKRAVWAKYGNNIALCCGDLMISRAYALLATLKNPFRLAQCISDVSTAVNNTILGQCLDINSEDWCQISTKDYSNSIANKSVPLIALSMTLPLAYKGISMCADKLNAVFNPFASAYQILDDVCDWHDDQANKRCNYLTLLAKETDYTNEKDVVSLALNQTKFLLVKSKKAQSQLPIELNAVLTPYIDQLLDKVSKVASDNA
jgi:geranylgeranyl diphosphate synthase type II